MKSYYNNKANISEEINSIRAMHKKPLKEAPIGDFSTDTSLKHVKQNSSDMREYVRYALTNKQDENEDYSVAQYILNNLKKDIEDNVKYWAKNRVDISKIKKDYEGCVALFDKYGTCPDKQLIMNKITGKIDELWHEYKKNFDSKLEKFGKKDNMKKRFNESISRDDFYEKVQNALISCIKECGYNFTYEEIEDIVDDAYEEIIGNLPQYLDRMFG